MRIGQWAAPFEAWVAQPSLAVRFSPVSRIQELSAVEKFAPAKVPVPLKTSKRTTATRLTPDAVRALATGRVALALGKPSQGRRSLSRFPASGPQGFWPVELNLICSS